MFDNIILDTDAYKNSHFLQYPEGTEYVHSYIESRGGPYGWTQFFGLQYIIQTQLSTLVTMEMVDEAAEYAKEIGVAFPYEGWSYIANELGGKLPLRIRAVPEGTVVPNHNVLATIENTDPKVPWLVSWFETRLLRVWYPISVATKSRKIKSIIEKFTSETVDFTTKKDFDFAISLSLNDFGSRGVSSRESAAIGGAAHLINFAGSDTVVANEILKKVYGAKTAPGKSINASEHSTITSWGRDGESEAYSNMIKQFSGAGIFAVVSDSYDLYNAITNIWGKELRQQVLDSGARVVVRPDSGNPVQVVLLSVTKLAEAFGFTTNSLGYKVLHPSVRVIQGDGIDEDMIWDILRALKSDGWSAENVVFGMGGALLQTVNRDTHRFAMKASHVIVNGVGRDVYKDPITDKGKKSKKGELELMSKEGGFLTIRREELQQYLDLGWSMSLEDVFVNGKVPLPYSYEEVTANASRPIPN